MNQSYNIIFLGANGSGKSTLGRELARTLNIAHYDVEDYWFYKTDIPYTAVRPKEERNEMLLSDMKKQGSFVMSGDVSGWSKEFLTLFDLVIFLSASTDIRVKRIENREYERWGERVCKGGDLYEQHLKFVEFAAARDIYQLEQSTVLYSCPVLHIDSTRPLNENIDEILNYINTQQETKEERLARLYPVILSDYNPAWPEWFAEEKENLKRLIGEKNIVRINHIGSTSVPGLKAKPTVDIMLEIKEDTDIEKLITAFRSPEYICLDEKKLTMPTPPPHLIMLKGYTATGFAEKVYHIHMRYPHDSTNHSVVLDELYFRDYLIAHPETAVEYATLKVKLQRDFEHDRDGYTNAKSEFVKNITLKAKGL